MIGSDQACRSVRLKVDVITRGAFSSVPDLTSSPMPYVREYNKESPRREGALLRSITTRWCMRGCYSPLVRCAMWKR